MAEPNYGAVYCSPFDLECISNLKFSCHQERYLHLLAALRRWNSQCLTQDKKTTRMSIKLHRFVYEELRIIKLEEEPARSSNLLRLESWYTAMRKQKQPWSHWKILSLRKQQMPNRQELECLIRKEFRYATPQKLLQFSRKMMTQSAYIRNSQERISKQSSQAAKADCVLVHRLFGYHNRMLREKREQEQMRQMLNQNRLSSQVIKTRSLNNSVYALFKLRSDGCNKQVVGLDQLQQSPRACKWRKDPAAGYARPIEGLTLMNFPTESLKTFAKKKHHRSTVNIL